MWSTSSQAITQTRASILQTHQSKTRALSANISPLLLSQTLRLRSSMSLRTSSTLQSSTTHPFMATTTRSLASRPFWLTMPLSAIRTFCLKPSAPNALTRIYSMLDPVCMVRKPRTHSMMAQHRMAIFLSTRPWRSPFKTGSWISLQRLTLTGWMCQVCHHMVQIDRWDCFRTRSWDSAYPIRRDWKGVSSGGTYSTTRQISRFESLGRLGDLSRWLDYHTTSFNSVDSQIQEGVPTQGYCFHGRSSERGLAPACNTMIHIVSEPMKQISFQMKEEQGGIKSING